MTANPFDDESPAARRERRRAEYEAKAAGDLRFTEPLATTRKAQPSRSAPTPRELLILEACGKAAGQLVARAVREIDERHKALIAQVDALQREIDILKGRLDERAKAQPGLRVAS
jgi:hypothetical protein